MSYDQQMEKNNISSPLPADLTTRFNQLRSEPSLDFFSGGSSSQKRVEKDHLNRDVEVLWLNQIEVENQSTGIKTFGFKMAEILPLLVQTDIPKDEIQKHLHFAVFDPSCSEITLDALMHAFLPFKNIDYCRPDSIMTIACSVKGQEICHQLWGDNVLWLDYDCPGFTLSEKIAKLADKNPAARSIIVAHYGLISWGETSQQCYQSTMDIIHNAEIYLSQEIKNRDEADTEKPSLLDPAKREQVLFAFLPVVRGSLSTSTFKVLAVDSDENSLSLLDSYARHAFSDGGIAFQNHMAALKSAPLLVDWSPTEDLDALKEKFTKGLEDYRARYQDRFNKYATVEQEMHPADPGAVLIPGLGIITAARNAGLADSYNKVYRHALTIINQSYLLNGFLSLSDRDLFELEYREHDKNPGWKNNESPEEFRGKVVLVTGAASGIGRATAYQFVREGAHVVIVDLNLEGARTVANQIIDHYGYLRATALQCDVGDEEAVAAVFQKTVLLYGGVDVVVNNAGFGLALPVEETQLKDWNNVQRVMATGYFLISREAFRVLKKQAIGGNLVFVCSKNSIRAGKDVLAYSSAKAAELHMARCLAEEGGEHGIRVNSVLPDAVLKGSSLFDSGFRTGRATAYGIEPDKLEDYYVQRCVLKVPVYPEHVSEAIVFLASERASRTTGGVLTVDGGVSAAYVR